MQRNILITVAFMMAPVAASAHPGGHSGFVAGLVHPLGGADHVLAMLAVGLWAAITGGRAQWAMPATFVGAMVVGGILGAGGSPFPAVEPMILASSVILGIAAALALRLPLALSLFGIAVFGLAHGHAHGVEAGGTRLLTYGAGFVLSTMALHLGGLAAGLFLLRQEQGNLARALGLVVAAVGAALMVSA